jgi:riboflavin kinase/FMN adenylyltransferase
VIVVRDPVELPPAERAVAIGTFDGVHRGHRAVVEAAMESGLRSTVVTFHPHPREVLGYGVELLASIERRLELIASVGPDETLVIEFTPDLSRVSPEEFVRAVLDPIGTRVVFAGDNFRFGRGRSGDAQLLRQLGFEVRVVPGVEGVSSSRIRELLAHGEVTEAAALLGRPHELEGIVVAGDQRGGTLGYPTANLAVPHNLVVPAFGIYAGAARATGETAGFPDDGCRAAISIGVNPHYGGSERRIEAYLLDYDGDLYGRALRIELWQRLREELAFESEAGLIEQIGRDVEHTRRARRPP